MCQQMSLLFVNKMFTIEKAIFLDFGHFFHHIDSIKTEIFVTNTYADFRHQRVRPVTKINPAMRKEKFRDEKQSTSEGENGS